MSESIDSPADERVAKRTKPAIGLVATGENEGALERAIARAIARDYPVLVTYATESRPTILDVISALPIRIVESHDGAVGNSEPKDRLLDATRAGNYPSLVYLGDASSPVDYDRSLEATDDGPLVVEEVAEEAIDCDVLVAIPAYNEGKAIASVVNQTKRHADDVVVVDDGSTDDTATNATRAGASVVSHADNRGYGAALQTAFEIAANRDVRCLVIVDGDGQHDADDIPTVAERVIDGEANVAIASRFLDETKADIPPYRRFGLFVINVLTNLSRGAISPSDWIQDTQSGFRAYDRRSVELLAETDMLGDDMDASIDILYLLTEADCTFDEVRTTVNYDVENANSQHPLRHGLVVVRSVLRTIDREHPLLTCSAFVGFVLFVFHSITSQLDW